MMNIRADFTAADDILREASRERLAGHGPIVIKRSGRIGPIVELTLASLQCESQYPSVTIEGGFAPKLYQALQSGQPFGSSYKDVAGVFPLGVDNPVTGATAIWDQWTVHAENIAKYNGLGSGLVD